MDIPVHQLGHLIIKPLPEDERTIYDSHWRICAQDMFCHQRRQMVGGFERPLNHAAKCMRVISCNQLQAWKKDLCTWSFDVWVSCSPRHIAGQQLVSCRVCQNDFNPFPHFIKKTFVELRLWTSIVPGRIIVLGAEALQNFPCCACLGAFESKPENSYIYIYLDTNRHTINFHCSN